MKGDFTRSTFDRLKHYSGVRMQQGRVQVDADWNEQVDLAGYRVETEARDLIGRCGGPLNGAGFAVAPGAPNLTISAGRYYVDGILCENEQAVAVTAQPSLPANGALVTLTNNNVVPLSGAPAGTYVAYLDVWTRHLTAIEDPAIREVALGGPDTATRSQTVWQVKLYQAGAANAAINCLTALPGLDALFAPPTGLLAARAQPGQVSNDPCIVAPGAGFRRLENQLYRVEVHAGGNTNTATFKWSRDNGSVVSAWESKNQDTLKVTSAGRDKVLGFAGGQWVELTDDTHEQLRQPGTLVRLLKAEGQVLTIDPATATGPVDIASFPLNPKVRRWDSAGAATIAVPNANQGWLALEDGVEVHFTSSVSYRTGDYWLIPARTATGDVEWPRDPGTQAPVPQAPHGVQHHFCRLAVLRFETNAWTLLADCRNLFPAATELWSLYHVEGDGQEACPNPAQQATKILLGRPLVVGVSNGRFPVQGARVRFTVTVGAGTFGNNLATFDTTTDANGLASTNWNVDATALNQEVEARLLDAAGQPVHLPVRFNASLSVASQVAYDPAACANLSTARTVQQALDILCQITGTAACEILVGPGQNFTRLDLAIQQLVVTEGRRDVRLCLLPGTHTLPNGLTIGPVNPKAQVSIHGGGRGTSIASNGRLIANGLLSFTLRDVEVTFNQILNPFIVLGCDDVLISHCRLVSTQGEGVLLTLENNGRATLANSQLRATFEVNTGGVSQGSFAQLLGAESIETLDRQATAIAQELTARKKSSRTALARKARKMFQEGTRDLKAEPPAAVERLLASLAAPEVDPQALAGDIQSAAGSFTIQEICVGLFATPGDVTLENNDISGPVSLYGDIPNLGNSPDLFLSEQELTDARPNIAARGNIGNGTSRLWIRGNRLQRVRLGTNIINRIKAWLPVRLTTSLQIPEAFTTIFFTGNLFQTSQFVATYLVVADNFYQVIGTPASGFGFGRQAVYSGNLAFQTTDNSDLLLSAVAAGQTQAQVDAANAVFKVKVL